MQRLEAVLFLAKEPLPTRKIAQLANLADGTEARTLVRSLNRLYDAAHRAFRVEEVAGGYELVTRPKFADWIRRLGGPETEFRLSSPALETLAIIAYRQPILRADVEAIRGVSCGEIIRQLMDRDLVQIKGRSEELGRPFLYSTTRHFLRTFGFRGLDDLPRSEEFRGGSDHPAAEPSMQNSSPDDKENAVSTVIAPLIPTLTPPGDFHAAGEVSAEVIPPIAQAPPIEDEEDDLYEGDEEDDEDSLTEIVDDEDLEDDDDWDEDFDDEDDDEEDDDLDEEEDDEDDDDEDPWEEVEDDDEEEDDEWDDEDDDEEDWDDDDEEEEEEEL